MCVSMVCLSLYVKSFLVFPDFVKDVEKSFCVFFFMSKFCLAIRSSGRAEATLRIIAPWV